MISKLKNLVAQVAIVLLVMMTILIPDATTRLVSAQSQTPTGAVLTLVLRDSYGQPLAGVRCEILSYDWGVPVGQPYAVIAQGETDHNGAVAFDIGEWPHSGYRFRFSKTDHTQPADTFFLTPAQNQYRGYPAALIGGAPATEYFAIASDGLAYNDLSAGQGSPNLQKDPVGGLAQSRLSPAAMSAQNFLTTARAATATAFAQVQPPTATLPPPPAPYKGVAGALTVTPPALAGVTPQLTPSMLPASPASAISEKADAGSPTSAGKSSPANQERSVTFVGAGANSTGPGPKTDLLTSVFLAVLGVSCFGLFWFNRHRIYGWLGVDSQVLKSTRRKRATGKKPQRLQGKLKAKEVASKPLITETKSQNK